jgi:hypothetical protein
MYDYFLDGKDNYEVDRAAADEVNLAYPVIKVAAQRNREFVQRSARWLSTGAGVRRYLDIGTGILTSPNVHDIVLAAIPDALFAYVDFDATVLRYAEALVEESRGRITYIHADVREPRTIIEAARTHLKFDKSEEPVAVLLNAVLHFINDESDPAGIVRELMEPLPSGSYLSLSHVTGDQDPEAGAKIEQIYRSGGTPAQLRSHSEISRLFAEAGLELVDPGLAVATLWHPELDPAHSTDPETPVYAGVARKP